MGMMMNRRRVMGGSPMGGLLPKGYRQVEYIENTSNAYIDTGCLLDFTETIKIKISVSAYLNQWAGILGNYSSESSNLTRVIQNNGDPRKLLFYYNTKATSTILVATVNGLNEINELEFNKNYSIINGVRYANNEGEQGIAYNGPILVFTYYYTFSASGVKGKLYYFEITGKRKMIPCKNPNNVVGMYDTVNSVFYSSPNGTAFIAGPEV